MTRQERSVGVKEMAGVFHEEKRNRKVSMMRKKEKPLLTVKTFADS